MLASARCLRSAKWHRSFRPNSRTSRHNAPDSLVLYQNLNHFPRISDTSSLFITTSIDSVQHSSMSCHSYNTTTITTPYNNNIDHHHPTSPTSPLFVVHSTHASRETTSTPKAQAALIALRRSLEETIQAVDCISSDRSGYHRKEGKGKRTQFATSTKSGGYTTSQQNIDRSTSIHHACSPQLRSTPTTSPTSEISVGWDMAVAGRAFF